MFFLHELPLEPFIDYVIFTGVILGIFSVWQYMRYLQKRRQLQNLLAKKMITEAALAFFADCAKQYRRRIPAANQTTS